MTIDGETQGWESLGIARAPDQKEQILSEQTGVGRGDFTMEEGT